MKKIFAAGYFGYGNFGDDLILSIFAKRTKKLFKVNTIPKMKLNPIKTLWRIFLSDAVVFPGGSVFQDETSVRNVFFWSFLIFIANIFGKPIFLLDQGFELKKKISVLLVKFSLKKAAMISTRERYSLSFLQKLGLNPIESADEAFHEEINRTKKPEYPPKKIGIIPRGNFKEWEKILLKIVDKFPQAKFKIAKLSPVDKTISEKIAGDFGNIQPIFIKTLDDMKNFLNASDLIVAAPFHAIICALISGTPFLAVNYSSKIEKFLSENGLKERLIEGNAEIPRKFQKDFPGITNSRIVEESSFQIFLNLLKHKI